MLNRLFKLCLFAFFCQNLTACGTIFSATSERGLTVYSGSKLDLLTVQDGGILAVLACIDLPLSFVFDTLLLPATLSR